MERPFLFLPKADARRDPRLQRRALTEGELLSLLDVARRRPVLEKTPIRRGTRKGEAAGRLREETVAALEFRVRVLSITSEIAMRWGRLCGEAEARGQNFPVIDSLIRATALVHGLTVATRNAADISRTGARTFNPL